MAKKRIDGFEDEPSTFKFGIGRPPRDEARAMLLDLMVLAHQLKNRLIQTDRARRQVTRSIQYKHPVLGPLSSEYDRQRACKTSIEDVIVATHQQELDVISAQIAEAAKAEPKQPTAELVRRRKAVTKSIKKECREATKHITTRLKEIGVELKEARVRYAAELEPLYEQVTAEQKAFQDAAINTQSDEEAAAFGFDGHDEGHTYTRWWTLANQQDSFQKRGKNLSPANDPPFRRFRPGYLTPDISEGTLCAGMSQTDDGGPLSALCDSTKGKLCIPSPPSSLAYDRKIPRGQRRRLQRTLVKFRVGSTRLPGFARLQPLWVDLEDVIFHREIPPNAIITEALLKLESVGAREKWFLILTIRMPKRVPFIPATTAPVFIRQNMHSMDGQLQYAELLTQTESVPLTFNIYPRSKVRRFRRFGPKADGTVSWGGFRRGTDKKLRRVQEGEVLLSDRHIQTIYDYQEQLTRHIDQHFNHLILGKLPDTKEHVFCVMDYIQQATRLPKVLLNAKAENVIKWRSHAKFQKLYRAWRDDRVEGDEAAFDLMYRWAYQDLHLHQWARDMLSRMIRRRENEFRVRANEICRRYSVIYLDNRTQVTTRAKDEEDDSTAASQMRKWLRRAAFATFREILIHTAKRGVVTIHPVDPTEVCVEELLGMLAAAE